MQGSYVIVPKVDVSAVVSNIKGKEWLTCPMRHILRKTIGYAYSFSLTVRCNTCSKLYLESDKYFWNC